MTVTQLRVPEKTNEITCFAALLDLYDLRGVTVTGDVLHTRRDHARAPPATAARRPASCRC
ncbi:hypothetical protein [Streptomyces sp. NPDC047061]|uniref:hypothetical protein n=1 Tax=Streptomyces sp. NPDC047061 TaxID=3154605 RepID=UPI0033E2F46D